MSAAIEVSSFTKRYGDREVVSNLSFEVEQGEFFALLGPNGAGKTTTIETLEGYRKPDSGMLRVMRLDPTRHPDELHKVVGVMLQEGGLYPTTKPRDLLKLYSEFYSNPVPTSDLVKLLGIKQVMGLPVRRLSGGQRQRLSLALALIGRPRLLFLDEPTAGLDPQARRATWEILRGLKAEGRTVVLTTHYLEEAEQLADRVAILDSGRLIALGSPTELISKSASQFRFRVNAPLPLDDLPMVAEPLENNWYSIPEAATPERVRMLANELAHRDILMVELQAGTASLEQVFLNLTGKEMRD